MTRNQYQYYWTTAQIKWDRCYRGYSELIYKDDLTKGNDSKCLFRKNSQDLLGQNLKNAWDCKENPQQQRTIICVKIYRGINEGIGNQKDAFNDISSTIR